MSGRRCRCTRTMSARATRTHWSSSRARRRARGPTSGSRRPSTPTSCTARAATRAASSWARRLSRACRARCESARGPRSRPLSTRAGITWIARYIRSRSACPRSERRHHAREIKMITDAALRRSKHEGLHAEEEREGGISQTGEVRAPLALLPNSCRRAHAARALPESHRTLARAEATGARALTPPPRVHVVPRRVMIARSLRVTLCTSSISPSSRSTPETRTSSPSGQPPGRRG
jgi:hypothetical protein